jgi:hypothetical protein
MDKISSVRIDIYAIALVAVLVLGWIIFLPMGVLSVSAIKVGFLCDDAFYYYKIARNVAAGRGFTFDGIHPTNGFHPLWLFLLVALYWVCQGLTPSLELMVRLILALQITMHAIIACLIYAIARCALPRTAALIAGFFWLLSPMIWQSMLSGMESTLNALFIALLVYVTNHQRLVQRRVTYPLLLTLLLVAIFLARLDGLILAPPYLVWV